MQSENETVADIVRILRGATYPVSRCPDLTMRGYADRIEAAYRREVAELRECLKDAIDTKFRACWSFFPCGECGRECPVHKWRKALEGENHAKGVKDEGK